MTNFINGNPENSTGLSFLRFSPGANRDDNRLRDMKIHGVEDTHFEQPYADAGRYVDVMWTRTNMFGAANANGPNVGGINDTDCMPQRWEWDWPATGKKQRKVVSGTVVDSIGNPVAGVTIMLFNTSTGALVDTQTSDTYGNWVTGDPNAVACFALGYLAGSPDREGTTVNTLTGI